MTKFGLFLLILLSSTAQANYYYKGKVIALGVANNGVLAISNGYGVHRIRNLSDDHCKAWMTFATSAKLADRNIQIY